MYLLQLVFPVDGLAALGEKFRELLKEQRIASYLVMTKNLTQAPTEYLKYTNQNLGSLKIILNAVNVHLAKKRRSVLF